MQAFNFVSIQNSNAPASFSASVKQLRGEKFDKLITLDFVTGQHPGKDPSCIACISSAYLPWPFHGNSPKERT